MSEVLAIAFLVVISLAAGLCMSVVLASLLGYR